ncbi:MAG: hypothetical protein ACYDCQ_13825 [Dehalococcoidia bacterium]
MGFVIFQRRWLRRPWTKALAVALTGIVCLWGVLAIAAIVEHLVLPEESGIVNHSSIVPDPQNYCAGGVAGYLAAAGPATNDVVTSDSPFLSPATFSDLGSSVWFVRGPVSSGVELPIYFGGAYRGHSSCDWTFSDNHAAMNVARSGAVVLAMKGLPLQHDGAPGHGEQRYLLRSDGFQPACAYVLYIFPDPTTAEPGPGRTIQYGANIYAIAVIAQDGTVQYAAALTP